MTLSPSPDLLVSSQLCIPSFSILVASSRHGNTSRRASAVACQEARRFPPQQLGLPSAPRPRRALLSLRGSARIGSRLRGARALGTPAQARSRGGAGPGGARADPR